MGYDDLINNLDETWQCIYQKENDCLSIYLKLALTLLYLKQSWPKTNSLSFNEYCFDKYSLATSTINSYLNVYKFLKTYRKFRNSGVPYSMLKNKLGDLNKWFRSPDANKLPASDNYSPSFWK
jgi:hypothetical protein